MAELYQEHIKEQFLSQYNNKNTIDTIKHIFIKSAETELLKEKDLFDFTIEEIEDMMRELNPKTTNSARTYGRFIRKYIEWSIEPKGYRRSNISLISSKHMSYFDNFIDRSLKLLYTDEEISEMLEKLVNYQDKVIVCLLFIGVAGDGLSEILNLTSDDIDFENRILNLREDDGDERPLEVSKEVIEIIEGALDKENIHYLLKNGQSTGKKSRALLVDNDYVIKSTLTNNLVNPEKASKHLIFRRLSMMSDKDVLDYPYLTASNIEKSGKIALAKDLYIERKTLGNDELKIIGDKFGMKKIMRNGELGYNLHSLRQYINIENLKGLYPEIFE